MVVVDGGRFWPFRVAFADFQVAVAVEEMPSVIDFWLTRVLRSMAPRVFHCDRSFGDITVGAAARIVVKLLTICTSLGVAG